MILSVSLTFSFNNELPKDPVNPFYSNSKPLVRWFWFATRIDKDDIRYQLDWVKKNNFGGVEIAWLYPLHRYREWFIKDYNRNYPIDTSASKWLSKEWIEVVAFAKQYSDSLGLACDFTYGTAWPTAGPNIEKKYGTQIYGDTSFEQLLTFSWSWPENMRVINHLDSNAFKIYSLPLENAFKDCLSKKKSSLFMDSWEIKLNAKNKIWTPGFDSTFFINFGYDIKPYMNIGLDSFPDVRYDYMLLLDEYVTKGFYLPFVEKCKELDSWSRVQCLGSPTDVMTAYSLVDIPESEAMLNDPNYSRIVSSSACLSSKKIVSSESFTCMYGFPATYLRQEQTADLKMVADALFSNGINMHVYIGMPFNPAGSDTIDFFASCYIGPGGSLTEELPQLNSYVEKVSGYMQLGKSYTDVAVYIPYEDAVMKGALPKEKQRVWVWGEYELRYAQTPNELEGYHPIWINRHFIEKSEIKNKQLVVGDARFNVLYIDVDYLDLRSLRKIVDHATKGLKICIKKQPMQPGLNKSPEFSQLYNTLIQFKNVSFDFNQLVDHPPLVSADRLPQYWCREDELGNKYLFLAQWSSKNLVYPVYSGQSFMKTSQNLNLSIYSNGKQKNLKLKFKPYQSILLKITPEGKVKPIDISYYPKDPIIRPREKQRMNF
ncbi:MAG: hypothetical protein IT267_04895 [Saprospiraceae bacterium]|nr:hypothetical protein [Saprospiraceae bacterium]